MFGRAIYAVAISLAAVIASCEPPPDAVDHTPNSQLVFRAVGPFATGVHPNTAAIGDFDGDGDVDVAVPAFVDPSLIVIRNDGGGLFTQLSHPSLPAGTLDAIAADVDGDGVVELVITLLETDQVLVLRATPGLVFESVASTTLEQPAYVAAGNLDDDGNLDLAVGRFQTNDVVLLFGDGTGNFTRGPSIAVPRRPGDLNIADIDGDGLSDIAVVAGIGNRIAIVSRDADGNWRMRAEAGTSAWPTSVEVGELDGDDGVELVGATNLGEGLFIAELVPPGIDLEPKLSIREQPAGGGAFDVAIADLDGDGYNDVTVTNKFADDITVFRNTGDGTLVEAITFPTGGGPTATPTWSSSTDSATTRCCTCRQPNECARKEQRPARAQGAEVPLSREA